MPTMTGGQRTSAQRIDTCQDFRQVADSIVGSALLVWVGPDHKLHVVGKAILIGIAAKRRFLSIQNHILIKVLRVWRFQQNRRQIDGLACAGCRKCGAADRERARIENELQVSSIWREYHIVFDFAEAGRGSSNDKSGVEIVVGIEKTSCRRVAADVLPEVSRGSSSTG